MPLKVTKIYGELPDEICLVSVLFILPFTYKLYQSIQIKLFINTYTCITAAYQQTLIKACLLLAVLSYHLVLFDPRFTLNKTGFFTASPFVFSATGPHQIIARFRVHSEGITSNDFFHSTINYRELFLCQEKVILKDARIRKSLTFN